MTETSKRHRSREEYAALLAEHAESGMTLRAFAEAKGIKPMTFYAWHRKLRPRPEGVQCRSDDGLVPVALRAPMASTESSDSQAKPAPFEVTIAGERVISVPVGFDSDELRRLVSVLESEC